jgi:hypothetical protein
LFHGFVPFRSAYYREILGKIQKFLSSKGVDLVLDFLAQIDPIEHAPLKSGKVLLK